LRTMPEFLIPFLIDASALLLDGWWVAAGFCSLHF